MRILILLWLGWYVSGPVGATFDYWDTARQETADVVRMGSGVVGLVGLAAAVALSQLRKLGERVVLAARGSRGVVARVLQSWRSDLVPAPARLTHSPPIPLRI